MHFTNLIQFLSELKNNNNKPWFDTNRSRYEELRKEWLVFVQDIIKRLGTFDSSIAHLEAKDCIFRINRDVRFSNDKSPYKSNFAAYFSRGGKKSHFAGYYLHIDPSEIFIAGGVWMPEPPYLLAIRKEIDYKFDEFRQIVEGDSFKKNFRQLSDEGKLSQVPKGFEKDNPAADYLKLKSFIGSKEFSQSEVEKRDFSDKVLASFKELKPLIDFLNRSFD